ncbi:MAG: glycosyltransferase [Candidatus Hodarchaeales archaeon]|jgi:hypothetical protein
MKKLKDLKVLHICNIAAVPQTLAKYQRKFGFQSDLITREIFLLPGATNVFPHTKVVTGNSPRIFGIKILIMARKYDIIHVHSFDKIIPILKRLYRRKKIILTYHGSDIRERWNFKKKYYQKADVVTVATPDLKETAPENVIYVPNMVDEDHFQRVNPFIPGTVIHVNPGQGHEKALESAIKTADERKLRLTVIDKSKYKFPHDIFPRLLELFEYYNEVKVNTRKGEGWLHFLSLTALQMLFLDGKVIFYGNDITSFPKKHDAHTVTEKWLEIYRS